MQSDTQHLVAVTVVGLFDDDIDAERALGALKKAKRPAAFVSVLARDRRAADDSGGALDVTQALVNTALATVGGWLQGIAALVVPSQGRFVAAGPIGALLSGFPKQPAESSTVVAAAAGASDPVGRVGIVFERFGFRPEEAHYLESRIEAGSALVAMTTSEDEALEATRRLFADHSAVFIGQAITAGDVVGEAQELMAHPDVTQAEGVIVTDIVVPLRKLCSAAEEKPALCGAAIVDAAEEPIGEVDELIAEGEPGGSIRYVVVGHGGVLGIARRRIAVPIGMVEFEPERVRIRAGRDSISGAPAYDPDLPFSRNHEAATLAYFAAVVPESEQSSTGPSEPAHLAPG